jgi:general secretion pathway protein M
MKMKMTLPQLSRRDQIALSIGGAVVLVTVIVMGIILPYHNTLVRLDAKIAAGQRQVREMQEMRQEYLALQRQVAEAENRLAGAQGFSLFSFVESAATRVAGRENLIYMRPQTAAAQEGIREEAVEVKLEKLRLDQLIRFLYALESADAHLQVKNLRVRSRFDNRAQLDALMTVSMYGRNA